jgi:hypothetical protein
MGAILVLWLRYTQALSVWIVGIGGVALGGAVFWAVAHALRCPEARLLPRLVMERLGRGKGMAPFKAP